MNRQKRTYARHLIPAQTLMHACTVVADFRQLTSYVQLLYLYVHLKESSLFLTFIVRCERYNKYTSLKKQSACELPLPHCTLHTAWFSTLLVIYLFQKQ